MNSEIADIEKWLVAAGLEESTLGVYACGNPRAVERIRIGSASIDTMRAVLAYIKENSPVRRGA